MDRVIEGMLYIPTCLDRVLPPMTGQMQNEAACETLEKVLRNTSDDCMVRHEVNEVKVAAG